MSRRILPGATLGVLGSGQLGRMFALAAGRLGYRVHTYSPERSTPTGQVSEREVVADYGDLEAVRDFARDVDVVTFEFENVPAATTTAAAEMAPVRPDGSVLHTTQNRLREKSFLARAGFPVTPFAAVSTLSELFEAFEGVADPAAGAILKTAGWGYDGKGQVRIGNLDEAASAWESLGTDQAILEKIVDFDQEVSIVAARGLDGAFAHYGLIANEHRSHILDVSTAPAEVEGRIVDEAVEIAHAILQSLEVVGVLCVELFLTRDGGLVVNELAPRPHNSGHLTVDAASTNQFEQQVRAVCGLPLGSPELLRPAAMANLMGDLWTTGEPSWEKACELPEVKLHLYGKVHARPGRKMGHLTALGPSAEVARAMVLSARHSLQPARAVGTSIG